MKMLLARLGAALYFAAAVSFAVLPAVKAETLTIVGGSGSGAPTDAPYYVTSANAGLSAEVVPSADAQLLLGTANDAAFRTELGLGTSATANTGTSGANVPLLNAGNTWSVAQTFSSTATSANATGTHNNGTAHWFLVTGSATGTQASAAFANTATWNTSGIMQAFFANITNTASAAASKLIDLQVASVSKFSVGMNGRITFDATVTAGGTTGAQTIDKPSGTVNFAAAASTLVVTNALVTTSSIVMAVVRTADSTAQIKNVVPASGSFTITLSAAATAETSVGFVVFN